jgi:hypothetical protein
MSSLPKTYKLLKNKYFIVIVFFLVWMAFFDPKDWGLIAERTKKLHDLEKSEKALSQQIAETRKELFMLKSNAKNIEKYAREKYYMKKDNEDIFIVNTNTVQSKEKSD